MARLPRLIGRGRAIESWIGSADITGEFAERYGEVTRALGGPTLEAGFIARTA